MDQVFAEAEKELDQLVQRFAADPKKAVIRLLLLALEREELVSMAYRQSQIADRLQRMSLPEEVRQLLQHAIIWIWKDEEMHAVYARGALMRLTSRWLKLQALAQQMGGILAGWASSVLHHDPWARAPVARALANLIVFGGRVTRKVPREVGQQLRYLPFREFCLVNAELEKASWMAWDRLALLAEQQQMMPEMILDFHRVAEDEIRHLRVFEAIAEVLTPDDQLTPGASIDLLIERIAAISPHFLPASLRRGQRRDPSLNSRVWSLEGAPDESPTAALNRILHETGLKDALHRKADGLNKPVSDLRVVIKTCFMLGYHHRDLSPIVHPELTTALVTFLREQGCKEISVAETRNHYDCFFQHRTVKEVAQYFGLQPNGFHLVDLSEDQQPHHYPRGMGPTAIAGSWRDADFRISFGKVRSHPVEMALLGLGNLEGIGGRSDQFLFAERQADRTTALMMVLDNFPPDFSLLDCYLKVPDGLIGMIGCPRPKHPRRFYAGYDPLAVDCVAARHLGLTRPEVSPILQAACHWLGGWPEQVEVVGVDRQIDHWRGPCSNTWRSLLSLLSLPVYVWGSGRGSLFVPPMDPVAFPPVKPPGLLLRAGRTFIRGLLGLRLPRRS